MGRNGKPNKVVSQFRVLFAPFSVSHAPQTPTLHQLYSRTTPATPDPPFRKEAITDTVGQHRCEACLAIKARQSKWRDGPDNKKAGTREKIGWHAGNFGQAGGDEGT
jgi:hypothetical protein